MARHSPDRNAQLGARRFRHVLDSAWRDFGRLSVHRFHQSDRAWRPVGRIECGRRRHASVRWHDCGDRHGASGNERAGDRRDQRASAPIDGPSGLAQRALQGGREGGPGRSARASDVGHDAGGSGRGAGKRDEAAGSRRFPVAASGRTSRRSSNTCASRGAQGRQRHPRKSRSRSSKPRSSPPRRSSPRLLPRCRASRRRSPCRPSKRTRRRKARCPPPTCRRRPRLRRPLRWKHLRGNAHAGATVGHRERGIGSDRPASGR